PIVKEKLDEIGKYIADLPIIAKTALIGLAATVLLVLLGFGPMIVSGLAALVGMALPLIGTALSGIGALIVTAMGIIFSPVGLAIMAAASLAWGLFTEDGRAFFANVGQHVIDGFNAAIALFSETFPEATQFIKDTWSNAVKLFDDVAKAIQPFWDWLKDEFKPIVKAAAELFGWLKQKWEDVTKFADDVFEGLAGWIKDKFGIDVKAIAQKTKETVGDVVAAIKHGTGQAFDSAKGLATDIVHTVTGEESEFTMVGNKKDFNTVDFALNFKGGGQLTGLNDVQTRALAATMAETESKGQLDADNRQGYFGQYQFGAEALYEAGLLNTTPQKIEAAKNASGDNWYKTRTAQGGMGGHEAFLRNPANWKISGGLDAFLKDKEMQDKAFIVYNNKNIAVGKHSKAINMDSPEEIAGYAASASLKGAGNANKLYKQGISTHDGNGTSTRKYAKRGENGITYLAPEIERVMAGGSPTPANDEGAGAVSLPNAIKTVALKDLKIKSSEATAGGKALDGTMDLARAIQGEFGSEMVRFNGFNDQYHQDHAPTSNHTKGLSLDLAIRNPKDSAKMQAKIKNLAASLGVNIIVDDEYKKDSDHKTGPHLHVSFRDKKDADQFSVNLAQQQADAIAKADSLKKETVKTDGTNKETAISDNFAKEKAEVFDITQLHNFTPAETAAANLAYSKYKEKVGIGDEAKNLGINFSLPETSVVTAQGARLLTPPTLPSIKTPKIADAPEVRETLASNSTTTPTTVNLPQPLVGQDLSSRSIAHIVTGGISRL
ncbi:MAG: hypothetical protein PHU14_16855, partial [Methylovulum sp.]|nr:hypothetical protein [Methylovulum sp.]